jgi:fructokinase
MRIGIDLGGTKIEAIALDDNGTTCFQERIATPRHDYTSTINAIKSLVNKIETEQACSATVGIGIPGAISPASGLVKNANSTWLIGQPFKQDLEQSLEREVRISNDANCFVVSEATDGAASDATIVFGVIIGTGTGGGIAINKLPIIGANAIAGEWGHNPMPWPQQDDLPGPECYCGKQGCIETYLSGTGFAREFEKQYRQRLTTEQIVELAGQGNEQAEQALQQYEDRMARALASVINILDPDVIVLGGGMSNISRLYKNVPERWTDYVFSDALTTQLRPPRHGDSSGVRGAAWLWPRH